jgi:hypothetical protein
MFTSDVGKLGVCRSTMEKEIYQRIRPPSDIGWVWAKTRTQQNFAFECTVSTHESNVVMNSHRPWLTIGGSYWKHWQCDTTAERDQAGPIVNRGNEFWPPGIYWRDVGWLDSWDAVLVESVRRVLQRWRGVCSFSLTMRSTASDEESHLMVGRRSKKRRRYEG